MQLDSLKNPQKLLSSDCGLKRFEKIAEIGKIVAKLILDGGDKNRYDDFLDAAITQSVLAIYASEAEKNNPQDDDTSTDS